MYKDYKHEIEALLLDFLKGDEEALNIHLYILKQEFKGNIEKMLGVVVEKLIKHSATKSLILDDLFDMFPKHRLQIIQNFNVMDMTLHKFFHNYVFNEYTINLLKINRIQDYFTNHPDVEYRLLLAKEPELGHYTLARLLNDKDTRVRELILNHPKISKWVLLNNPKNDANDDFLDSLDSYIKRLEK